MPNKETAGKYKYASHSAGMGGIWFLGFIGTLVYYLHFHSGNVTLVGIAIFKALFWPAYLVYYLLQNINA